MPKNTWCNGQMSDICLTHFYTPSIKKYFIQNTINMEVLKYLSVLFKISSWRRGPRRLTDKSVLSPLLCNCWIATEYTVVKNRESSDKLRLTSVYCFIFLFPSFCSHPCTFFFFSSVRFTHWHPTQAQTVTFTDTRPKPIHKHMPTNSRRTSTFCRVK